MRQTIDSLARTPLSQVVVGVVVLTIIRFAIAPILNNTPAHQRMGMYKFLRFFNEFIDALVYAGIFVFLVIRPFVLQAFLIPSGSMWPTLYVNDFIVANKAIYRFSEPKVGDIIVFRPPVEAVGPNDIGPDGQVKVDYIKRMVGGPGDIIEIRAGQIYRNGQLVQEPFKSYSECTRQVGTDCADFRKLSDLEIAGLTKANFKLVKQNGKIIPFNWTQYDGNSMQPHVENFSEGSPYPIAAKYAVSDQADADKLKAEPAEKIPPGHYLMMGDNRNGSFDGRAWGLIPRDAIVGRSEAIWLPFSRLGITR
ncbi:hypothetical protein BH11ARM2_BH11ARM2_18400 [soil metagenome]